MSAQEIDALARLVAAYTEHRRQFPGDRAVLVALEAAILNAAEV